MAVLLEQTRARARPRDSLDRFLAWHPEWWVYGVAVVAASWMALPDMVQAVSDVVTGHDHSTHVHVHAAAPETFWAAWAVEWGRWGLMVAAMMLPIVAPRVRAVATRSLWSRRHRAAVVFTVGFAAVWMAVGAVLVALPAVLRSPAASRVLLVEALAAAALWHVAPLRRRVLRRCASLRLGSPTGLTADLECARAGVRIGGRCAFTCGPMMLAMVFSHSLLLMTALFAVMVSERSRGPDPLRRAGRPQQAWALFGFALVAAAWALVQ